MKWATLKESMTMDHAFYVKHLRCGPRMHSWRRIAELCAEKWDGDWGDNQFAGRDLCEYAAEMFGENYNEEPWN